jgi:hypothetical protein
MTRRARRPGSARGLACCGWLVLLAWPGSLRAQADDAQVGRDFPKTLTLDEPGVDDEISLPTAEYLPDATDIAFELDKRLTERLQLQVNVGYRTLADAGVRRYGWDDAVLTAKYVVLDRPSSETIVTLGATHAFGGSGAAAVGAAPVGSTTPTLYVGQGFGAMGLPALLRPFAITGTFGTEIPDRAQARGANFGPVLHIGNRARRAAAGGRAPGGDRRNDLRRAAAP